MSTNDPLPKCVLTPDTETTRVPEDHSAGIGSLPDLAVITRLANEFFSAFPGVSLGRSLAPLPDSVTHDVSNVPSSPVPTEAPLARNTPDATAPNVPLSVPAYPSGPEKLSPFNNAPSLSALSDAFAFSAVPSTELPASPGPPWPEATEAELSAIPSFLTDVTPYRSGAYAQTSPPSLPGGPGYFLDESRRHRLPSSTLTVTPALPGPDKAFLFPNITSAHSVPDTPRAAAPPASRPQSVPELDVSPQLPSLRERSTQPPTSAITSSEAAPVEAPEFHPEIVPSIGLSKRLFDPHIIKRDFPILQQPVNGRPLVWLDNAATTQKPNAVIDRLSAFYRQENSNIHRAAHALAARATDAYESAREKVRRFLNARAAREVIFVRGTTEGINLVAKSWGHRNVQKDDEIVITLLEHHANIVPWQQLAAEKGARLRVAPVDNSGQIILEEYEKLLGPRTRIVSVSQVSNALGTITPVKEMIEMAHRHGARVLVDGAQSVAHMATDVQALDCDFFVFSGHKIFAPTGVGVVFGKSDLLEEMPPWQGGGNMIIDVTFEKTIYNVPPARFEAGTGTIADAVGLGAALDYLDEIGMENISRHEHELVQYGTAQLLTVPGLRLIGTANERAGVFSLVLDTLPPEEVGKALDQEGIAVRAGHHCAQPILRRFGVEKTVRPSLALYNTREDIDTLVAALQRIQAGAVHAESKLGRSWEDSSSFDLPSEAMPRKRECRHGLANSLNTQLELGPRVGDAKALPFGIALRHATGRSAEHGQIASDLCRILQSGFK